MRRRVRPCTPKGRCVPVQTVSLAFSHLATAARGSSGAWAMYWTVYDCASWTAEDPGRETLRWWVFLHRARQPRRRDDRHLRGLSLPECSSGSRICLHWKVARARWSRCLDHGQCLLCGPGVGRDHADEVTVADELDAGHLLGGRSIERGERGVVTSGTQDFAEHHAGQNDVRWVLVLSGYEIPAVGLGNGRSGDLPVLAGISDTLPETVATSFSPFVSSP